ncbi:uncharacterized protein MEPE_02513 [Melanopsichium pennsylvanicum]|uniref:Uncharacterized protein n=2 Tax=Melanopsichium pennsylvanicum TaxID=63383 RepID=A0AAJ5C4L7_9BASI|nr:uncharacterized protein BN887_06125 [Melanopsichium pennsylvanicum 4]SNX83805.1 uncharacterized protein MEPE_02513 [Melanopsichium pennsylvanicum]
MPLRDPVQSVLVLQWKAHAKVPGQGRRHSPAKNEEDWAPAQRLAILILRLESSGTAMHLREVGWSRQRSGAREGAGSVRKLGRTAGLAIKRKFDPFIAAEAHRTSGPPVNARWSNALPSEPRGSRRD